MSDKIRTTYNYSKFKFFESNRDLKPRNVSRLMESMKQIGVCKDKPIMVDKNFNVLDGQHRLEACKRLELPVYYIFSNYKESDIPTMNASQENWKTEDYIKYHAIKGVSSYKLLLEIQNKCHATLSGIMAALDCIDNKAIKDGSFTLFGDSDELAKIVEDRLDLCYKIRGKRSISRKICLAVNYLSRLETFDYKLLKKRIEERPHLVHRCDTVNEYIKIFTNVYNFRKHKNKINNEDLFKIHMEKF